jgi:hypothetical protein
MNQKANFTVDINSLPQIQCECGSIEFQVRLQLRKISALQSPTGTDGAGVFQTGYICNDCRKLFDLGGNPIEPKKPIVGGENG